MDADNDPNAPDCTNGDFFCRLCLASMNSETMWASHIAGKRHIKNAQKYPNGLKKRRMSDDEDSYDRPPKHERLHSDYGWGDSYPADYDSYYKDRFYQNRPPDDYIPIIKPNVVFDYGHTKKLEVDTPPPLPPPVLPQVPPAVPKFPSIFREPKKEETNSASLKLDEILNSIMSETAKRESERNDDFFEKINQREIAKDIAKELAQKRVYSNKIKATEKKSETESTSSVSEKYSKRKSSDIFDILHKHNEKKLFKETEEDNFKTKSSSSTRSSHSRSSSQEKSVSRKKEKSDLNNFDPDKLTPDVLDDLLSVHLKPKVTNSDKTEESKSKERSVEEKAKQLDDPEILAEKLNTLPTMKFLEIFHKKLKNLDLKDSEELKMVLNVLSAAQDLVCKKLPPNLQAVLNATMFGDNAKNTEVHPQNVPKSVNPTNTPVTLSSKNTAVSQNYPTVAPQPQGVVPTVPVAPPLPTVVSQSQTLSPGPSQAATVQSKSAVQSAITSQSQLHSQATAAASVSSTVASQKASSVPRFSFPGMPAFPSGFPMLPAVVNPIRAATNQPPTPAGVPSTLTSPAAWQNYQMYNYYRMMQYMYANRHTTPSNVNSVPNTSQASAGKQTGQSKDKSSEQSKDTSSEQLKDKSSEQSKDKLSEQPKDKYSDHSKNKYSDHSKDKYSDHSKDKYSDHSKSRLSEYSKDKSSEYSKSRSSEYLKDKPSEYSKSKYSEYSNNKHTNNSNTKLSEHSRNKQSEPSKSSQPNQPPPALNPQTLQASKELLETLKKLQELSEEYKKSTSAKKTK